MVCIVVTLRPSYIKFSCPQYWQLFPQRLRQWPSNCMDFPRYSDARDSFVDTTWVSFNDRTYVSHFRCVPALLQCLVRHPSLSRWVLPSSKTRYWRRFWLITYTPCVQKGDSRDIWVNLHSSLRDVQIHEVDNTSTGICYRDWRTYKVFVHFPMCLYCPAYLTLELSMVPLMEVISVSSLMAH